MPLSPPSRRETVAVVASALSFAGCFSFSIVLPAQQLVLAVISGIVAGLIASSRRWAAAAAAAGLEIPRAATIENVDPLGLAYGGGWLLITPVCAAAIAYGVARFAERRPRTAAALFPAVGVSLTVVGMVCAGLIWGLTLPALPDSPPLVKSLDTPPMAGSYATDQEVFIATYHYMRRGMDYYAAEKKARDERIPGADAYPGGAVAIRLPTLYKLWAAMPFAPGWSIFGPMLVLAVLGTVAAFVIGLELGDGATALAGVACAAGVFTPTFGTGFVLTVEPWAAALVAIAVALWLLARDRGEGWLWAAVAVALGAALFRELTVYLLVAGLIAQLAADRRDTRRLLPWVLALLAFVAAYAVHVKLTGRPLFQADAGQVWFSPRLERPLRALVEEAAFLGGYPYTPIAMTLLGLFGVFTVGERRARRYLALAVFLPYVAFSVFGPVGYRGLEVSSGAPGALAYWVTLARPALFACSAAALTWFLRREEPEPEREASAAAA